MTIPKILIENENDRVYTPEYGVPTICLGDGQTVVSHVIGDAGFHGVCFTECTEDSEVGDDRTSELRGRKVDEIRAYFQIITTNPRSLEVLISKLQLAKDALVKSIEDFSL